MPYHSAGLNYARSDENSYRKVQVWLTNSTADRGVHDLLMPRGAVFAVATLKAACLPIAEHPRAIVGPIMLCACLAQTFFPIAGRGWLTSAASQKTYGSCQKKD